MRRSISTVLSAFTLLAMATGAPTLAAEPLLPDEVGVADLGPTAAARSFLLDTPWPTPVADGWRTSAASGAGLPAGVTDSDLVTSTAPLSTVPFFGITYSDDVVFILGGSPFLLGPFSAAQGGDPVDRSLAGLRSAFDDFTGSGPSDPYLAKVTLGSMEVETLEFPKREIVNYIGGVVAHENGHLYVVATATLHEVDPTDLTITRSLELPLFASEPVFSVYNGLLVSPVNGNIILKLSNFKDSTAGGTLISVDPEEMVIRTMNELDVGTARMAIAFDGATEYIYLPGATLTNRFEVTSDGFVTDEAWAKTYRSDGDGTTQAVATLYAGPADTAVFTDNNTVIYGVTAPLSIYTQSTTDVTAPVTKQQAMSTSQPGGDWFMVVGDPYVSGIIVSQDVINGLTSGWQLGSGGTLTKVWESDRYRSSSGGAIAIDQGHLYVDDRQCPEDDSDCTLYLVVVDLQTGEELARTVVAGTVPSMAHIFIGSDAVYHISSEEGKDHGFLTWVGVQ